MRLAEKISADVDGQIKIFKQKNPDRNRDNFFQPLDRQYIIITAPIISTRQPNPNAPLDDLSPNAANKINRRIKGTSAIPPAKNK